MSQPPSTAPPLADVQIDLVSGGGPGAQASIKVDGVEVAPGGYGRGLNVAVLDQSTGVVLSFTVYDTHASSAQADAFAQAMEALPIGRLVLIAVADDASHSLSERARRACQMLGSARIFDLGYRAPWALIGQRGAAPGTHVESLAPSNQVTARQAFKRQGASESGFALRASSAAVAVGDRAEITIEGVLVAMSNGYERGMNVAVLDEMTAAVLHAESFDTGGSRERADELAALLEGLPPGRIVIVAAKGDAATSLTERAKAALESIGSRRIAELTPQRSWSMVGWKFADAGAVSESLGVGAPSRACWWLTPLVTPSTFFTVSVESAGQKAGDRATVLVDSTPVIAAADATRGYNVAVISPATGIVSARASFDVPGDAAKANALAEFIDSVPVGWLVAIAVRGDGQRNLNENARRALRSVGSALIGALPSEGSFALVGVRGASPGSVPELVSASDAVAATFRFAVPEGARLSVHELRAYSAGFEVGNMAAIVLDGALVPMPGGYRRGLNVAVIGRDGTIQHAEVFDTYESTEASERFASLVEGAPQGQVIVVAVRDEAVWHLTARARAACRALGSIEIDHLEYRQSWALVGIKGRLPGTVAEMRSATRPALAHGSALAKLEEQARGIWLGAGSAGYAVGNFACLRRDGAELALHGRGLNVAVLDEVSGAVLHMHTYDTYASRDAAEQLAGMIEALPAGRLVAIAVQDEATQQLTDRARRALTSLGSAVAPRLAYRESWAMIGYKGAPPGSAMESARGDMPVAVQGWFGFLSPDALGQVSWFLAALFAAVVVLVVVVIVVIVITSIFLPSPRPTPFPVPTGRRRAVFVGIDYVNFAVLDLKGLASQIVEELRRSLCNSLFLTEAEARLLTERSGEGRTPSRTNVVAALRWLIEGAQDGDVLYFHYLGHGGRDTLAPEPYEYLITLTESLKARDVLKEAELKALIAAIPTKVNLTFAFHCCFSGDLIDHSAAGRGIALAATTETDPAHLRQTGNFTGAIKTKMQGAITGKVAWPTYEQLRSFIEEQPGIRDSVELKANPALYEVKTLLVLKPLK